MATAGLLLVFIGSALAGTQQNPTPPRLPPYVRGPFGPSFDVRANGLWKGAVVKQVVTADREATDVIWTKACPHGAQIVTFTRALQLFGPPGDATFQFVGLEGSFASPFRTVDLKVNGKLLLSKRLSPSTHDFTQKLDDRSVHSAFRDGENEVEVRISRAALPSTVKNCNAGKGDTSDLTHLGVELALTGDFVADATVEKKPATVFVKTNPADSFTVRAVYRFTNNGPSAASVGQLFIAAIGRGALVENTTTDACVPGDANTTASTGVAGVVFVPTNGSSYTIACRKSDFKPGETATVTVRFSINGTNSDFTEEHIIAGATATMFGPTEPDPTNNQTQTDVTFCGKLSTLPGCATASSTSIA